MLRGQGLEVCRNLLLLSELTAGLGEGSVALLALLLERIAQIPEADFVLFYLRKKGASFLAEGALI